MGLFNFIKEAGAKLLGGGAKAATPEDLKKEVQSHGFDARTMSQKEAERRRPAARPRP